MNVYRINYKGEDYFFLRHDDETQNGGVLKRMHGGKSFMQAMTTPVMLRDIFGISMIDSLVDEEDDTEFLGIPSEVVNDSRIQEALEKKGKKQLLIERRLLTFLSDVWKDLRFEFSEPEVYSRFKIPVSFDEKEYRDCSAMVKVGNFLGAFDDWVFFDKDVDSDTFVFMDEEGRIMYSNSAEKRSSQPLKYGKFFDMLFSIQNPSCPDINLYPQSGSFVTDWQKKAQTLIVSFFREAMIENMKPITEKVRVSKDVTKIYRTPTALKGTGSLGSSCMNRENHKKSKYEASKHTGVYDHIPHVRIAYMKSGEKLLARAILWEKAYTKEGEKFKFMDRIYGSERAIIRMKRWAKENGYFYKVNQTYTNPTLYDPFNEKVVGKYFVKDVKITGGLLRKGLPYFDSLEHLKRTSKNKTLLNMRLSSYSEDDTESKQSTRISSFASKCDECGRWHFNWELSVAINTGSFESKYCCKDCTFIYNGTRYIKQGDEIEITKFRSDGSTYKIFVPNGVRTIEIVLNGEKMLLEEANREDFSVLFDKIRSSNPDSVIINY